MTTSTPVSETQTFTITEEISVAASLDQTFDSLIAQMGPVQRNAGRHPAADGSRAASGRAVGTGTSAATTGTCGGSSRVSSGPRCWRSGVRCSCPRRPPRTCCTGSARHQRGR
jgi:hypothetical protein